MENKQNDWIAVNLNNQNVDFDDLRQNDITPDNTGLQDKDYYKDTKKIQETFTDPDTGKFNDDAYNQFYDTMSYAYNAYAKDNFVDRSFKNFEYGPATPEIPKGAKVEKDLYKIQNVSNPFHQKIGVEGYNVTSKRELTVEELAEQNNVKDYKTGEDLGYSLNDSGHGGLVGLFRDPTTVVAQYDEDGTHYDKQAGRNVSHKKGDYKYDENGDFYLETLGDREAHGKRIMNWTDTLTTDGSFANKFDFMDSDGLDKSIFGTVMKTAAKVIPLFIPYVGEVYAAGLIGTELLDMVPTVYKAIDAWVDGPEASNSDTWKTMSKIQGFSKRLSTGSTSEYARGKMMSVEGLGNLVADTFQFLYSQKALTSIPGIIGMKGVNLAPAEEITKLFGEATTMKAWQGALSVADKTAILEAIPEAASFLKSAQRVTNAAKGLSTAYLSASMATPVVEAAKELNLNDRDAGALYVGTSLGLFAMMKYLKIGGHGLGEWAVRGFGIDDAAATAAKGIKAEANGLASEFSKITNEVPIGDPTRYQKIVQLGKSIGQKVANNLADPSQMTGAFLSQGIEMTGLQVVQDNMKIIYNGLAANGWTSTQDPSKKFKFDLSDTASNYLMNFIGGGLGGVLMNVHDNILKKVTTNQDSETKYNLEYLIRNGYKDALLDQIEKQRSKGLLGSTNLSTEHGEVDLPGLGKQTIFKPTTKDNLSQNDFIANALKFQINDIQNQIFQEGVPSDIKLSQLYNARTEILVDLNANSTLREDVQKITSKMLDLKNQLSELGDVTKIENPAERDTSVKKATELKQQLNEQNLELMKINSGEKFLEYQKQALFNMSSTFNDPFGAMTLDSYSRATEGKHIFELDVNKQADVKAKYDEWKDFNRKDKLKEGYSRFTYLNEKFSNNLQELAKYASQRRGHYDTVDFTGNVLKYSLPLDQLNKVKSELGKNVLLSDSLGQSIDEIADFALKSDKIDSDLSSEFRKVFTDTKVSNVHPNVERTLEEQDENGFPEQQEFTINHLSDNLLDDLKKTSVNNIDEVYNKYKDIIEKNPYKLEENKIYDQTLLDKTFNTLKSSPEILSFQAKQLQFEQSVAGKEIDTFNDLLRSFSKTRDGEESDFFKTLGKEYETLAKEERITDYIIKSPKAKEELESALQLLNEFEALKEATTEYVYDIKKNNISGYNSTINKTIKDSALGIISQEQSILLQKDIDTLKTKIDFLLHLSKINGEDKLKNQKRSGLVMESLFYGNLISDDNVYNLRNHLDSLIVGDEKFINRDIESAIANATTLKASYLSIKSNSEMDSSDDTLAKIEIEKMAIQTALHNRAKELIVSKGKKVLLDSLFNTVGIEKVFPVEVLSNPRTTDFSHDSKTVEPFDLFVWFNTSLIVNPAEFNAHLKGSKTETETGYDGIESSDYAPFYAQEYSTKVAYGLITDKEWVNRGIDYFGDKSKEGVFLKNINSTLHNSVFIDGTPGSGKTTGVANLLSKILNRKGLDFWTVGPHKNQADNLNKTLDGVATKTLDRKGLIDLLINNSEALYSDLNTKKEGEFISKATQEVEEIDKVTGKPKKYIWNGYKLTESFDDFKKLDKEIIPKAIFIDEITHFSAMELSIIDKAFSKMDNPPTLILMGDLDQNGYKIESDSVNINQINTWQTAKLSGSLRVANNIKKDNLNFIRAEYKEINQKYYDLGVGLIDSYDVINNAGYRIKLGYHEENGIVSGEKIIPELNMEVVKSIISGEKIAYITDNPTSELAKLIQSELSDKIEIITPDNVQGSEYDHTIIDVNWGNFVTSKEHGLNDLISNLYTLTTRSREGSIIVDNGLTGNGLIRIDKISEPEVIKSGLDPQLVNNYKKFRVNIINTLLKQYPFDLTSQDSKVRPPETKIKDHASDVNTLLKAVFEEKQGTEEEPTFTKTFNSSKVLIYPFNKRLAAIFEKGKWNFNPNEDLGYFLKDDPNMSQKDLVLNKEKLQNIKTSYLHNQDLKKIDEILGDENLDVNKTKIIIRASKYNYKLDRDSETGYNTAHPNNSFVRVALEIPKKDGSPVYFTIGTLSQRSSMEQYQKSTGKIQKSLDAYNNLFKQIETDLKTNDTVNYNIDTKSIERSSNVKFRKISGKKNSVIDLKAKNKNAIFSPVYILTGEGSIISSGDSSEFKDWINNKRANGRGLAGQAMMLVTYDSTLRGEDLVKIYAKERTTKPDVPKVRMIMVDPKGYKFTDWLAEVRKGFGSLKEGKSFKPVSSLAAPELAGRIFNSIYNISQMNKSSFDPDTKRAVEYSKEYLKRIVSALGKDELKINFETEQGRLDFVRSLGIDYDIAEGQEVKSLLSNKFDFPILNFKYNHTYNLLLAMDVAWRGGSTIDGDKVSIDSIFKYAPGKDRDIFMKFLDTELKKSFPEGIFTHPVFMTEGKSATDNMDYAELAVQNLDKFEVNVDLDYFTGLLDLSKFEKEKTPEQQLISDKIDISNNIIDKINNIKKTLVDPSGEFNKKANEVLKSINLYSSSEGLKKDINLLNSKIDTIEREIKTDIQESKPINYQENLDGLLKTQEDPKLSGLNLTEFKISGRTGKKFAFTAENSNFVVDGIYDSSKNKISKMTQTEKFARETNENIEILKTGLLEKAKIIREDFAKDPLLISEVSNFDYLTELINDRKRLIDMDPKEQSKMLEAMALIDFVKDKSFKENFNKYITEQDINTCK